MSIAAPPKSSCSTTHFRYEKGFFYKIRCGVLEQRACIYSGARTPATTVFSDISVRRCKNCLEFSIAWGRLKIFTWQFHSCTIFEAYLIKSLCDSPKTVFWWFHLFFRSGFVCSVLFSRLNSQWAKKKKHVFVERNNFTLVTTVLFFFAV